MNREAKIQGNTLAAQVRSGRASRSECESYGSAMEHRDVALNPTHEGADAFWKYWRENGETHKHGYYESTWGAINAAIKAAGLVKVCPTAPVIAEMEAEE